MARRIGRIVTITALVLIVVTGIVVGTLFAVGVLGKKSGGSPPSGSYNVGGNCEEMPTVNSFNRLESGPLGSSGLFRLSFSPIFGNCIAPKTWMYYYTLTNNRGQSGQTGIEFKPTAGQSFIDIPMDLPYNDPSSPVKSVSGEIWLQTVNANGTGDLLTSNKLPYVFIIN